VVERGTAKPTKSDIITLAGKTGTAEIPDLENGGYLKNKFMASFFGFFPAEDPKVAGIVVLKRPEPVHYGGHTAGPAFRNMAERYAIANSERFNPKSRLLAGEDVASMTEIYDFVGRDIVLARKIAEKEGINLAANCTEGMIVWQYPPEGRRIPGKDIVAVAVRSDLDEGVTLFDMKGMKIRTAMAVLEYQGVDFKISGTGQVKKQFPKAGSVLKKNLFCTLKCGT
jgi:stage V sporulation protein D (sporulation-specific penicillin-binding protein)